MNGKFAYYNYIIFKYIMNNLFLYKKQKKPQINKPGFININLMGGLCNQMFQIAAGYALSLKYNKILLIKSLDKNPHSNINYFDNIFRKINNKLESSENNYVYTEPKNECLLYRDIPNFKNIELNGYFQNENYFMEYRNEILELLKIESKQNIYLREKYTDLSNSYFIHIRKGDYVNNSLHDIDIGNYYQKSIEYIKSINDNPVFYIFSNDIEYCKTLSWLNENTKFIDLDEVNSLYLMSMCFKGGIAINSSYSWWGGYLNTNMDKLVIYPDKWFNSDWKTDIGWIGCNIMNLTTNTLHTKKYDLQDTTFILAIRIEHNDRLVNLNIILKYISYFFNTNFIIIENGEVSHYDIIKNIIKENKLNYEFQYNTDTLFNRMKILNECLSKVKTKVVVNYDIDCLLPIQNYIKCQDMILNNTYDLIHPFNNPDGVYYIDVDKKDKIDFYNIKNIDSMCRYNTAGNGFVIFFNTSKYRYMGGENENFLAYGPEDNERIYRAVVLGLKYGRLNSKIYHLEHYRSENSFKANPYFIQNTELFENIKKMNITQLKSYYKII